jgi:hypothetical protein
MSPMRRADVLGIAGPAVHAAADKAVRAAALYWIHDYNWHRPDASLGYNPPCSRLPLPRNNLLRLHRYTIPTRWSREVQFLTCNVDRC